MAPPKKNGSKKRVFRTVLLDVVLDVAHLTIGKHFGGLAPLELVSWIHIKPDSGDTVRQVGTRDINGPVDA